METRPCLDIAREGEVAIVSFTGSCIDVGGATNTFAQLREYLAAHPPRRMVFDFSGVTFVSTWVLSLLLEMRTRLEPQGGEVVVAALSPQLQRVLAIAHLDKTFRFYADKAAAVREPPDTTK